MNSSQKLNLSNFFFILIFLFTGKIYSQAPAYCSTNRFTDVALFDSSDIRTDTDIIYAVSKNYFTGVNDTLRMNVFYPDTIIDTMSARPFILLIHGGAFISGSLHEMEYQCMEFARRGFVTATISYRLGWNCSGTDFLSICLLCGNLGANVRTATYEAAQDGRAAMRYIDAIHSQYKIDSDNYFIGGTSAGSITAMHTAFWDQQEADTFCPWATAQVGLLDTAGNAMPHTYQLKGVIDNCGAVSQDSVILNNGNIPLISFHDEGDCVVPNLYGQVISCACQAFYWVAGSAALHGLLDANGICTSMNLVPLSINHCSFPEYELINRASCFIRSVLCDSCQTSYNNTPYVLQRCSNTSDIRDENLISSIQVFPNPSSEKLQLDGLQIQKYYFVFLYDLSGRIIFNETIKGESQHSFKLNNIAAGSYFLKINSGQETRIEKILLFQRN
ncbi:MAG: T9SS type A sorting domain-containing protein [Bacteroidota bacterium]